MARRRQTFDRTGQRRFNFDVCYVDSLTTLARQIFDDAAAYWAREAATRLRSIPPLPRVSAETFDWASAYPCIFWIEGGTIDVETSHD